MVKLAAAKSPKKSLYEALIEVELKITLDSAKGKVVQYELVGSPKVLVNNMRSKYLMNPTEPTLAGFLNQHYPGPVRDEGEDEDNNDSYIETD
jgi:hypothetical protein